MTVMNELVLQVSALTDDTLASDAEKIIEESSKIVAGLLSR
jgi:hypothetical protein